MKSSVDYTPFLWLSSAVFLHCAPKPPSGSAPRSTSGHDIACDALVLRPSKELPCASVDPNRAASADEEK